MDSKKVLNWVHKKLNIVSRENESKHYFFLIMKIMKHFVQVL